MTRLEHRHPETADAAYLPRLRAAYDGLSRRDRARLAAEVASGDPTAMGVVQALAWSLGDAGNGEGASRVPPLGPRLA